MQKYAKSLNTSNILAIFAQKLNYMNRKEFCEQMANAKNSSDITTTDLSFAIKMLLPTLRRFEKGEHNFKLDRAIQYLNILQSNISLTKGNTCLHIKSYEDVISFIKDSRKGKFTQRELAEEIGCKHPTVANIERGSNIVTIDNFLKIVDVLGYTLKIENNEKN